MRYSLTIVEQLDRAATELATDHPINNRLALILIDNATELILHRQCIDRLERDSFYSNMLQALQSLRGGESSEGDGDVPEDWARFILKPGQRAKAKGKSLPDKLKVLQDMGDLSSAERKYIQIAHGYRNELYHVGLTRDDIIRAVAGHYFLLCCDLFARMGNLNVWKLTISSSDQYSEVARRYLPMRNGRIDLSRTDDMNRDVLAEKLIYALPNEIPSLAETLAASARNSIKAVMDNFEFLIADNPFGFDATRMLEAAQRQQDLTKALESQDVDGLWVDPNYRQKYDRVARELDETWRQKHTSIPQDKWLTRATAIEREADPLVALDLYNSLRKDMSYLEEAIESASQEIDKWIQREIDMARGK